MNRQMGLSLIFTFLAGLPVAQAAMGFVDLPKGCFGKEVYPCQVRVSGGFLTIERSGLQMHLSDQSSLSFLSQNEVQLLSGQIWVRKSQNLNLRLSALLKMKLSGEWFFERAADATILARNLQGDVRFESSKVFENEALPVGFQNWFGGLDATGQISRGLIRPIEMAAFLKEWLPLSGFSRAEMQSQIGEYRELWKEGPEISAQFYGQVVSRRLAAVEEKERKQQERAEALRQERLKIRNMYRNRNGLAGPEGL